MDEAICRCQTTSFLLARKRELVRLWSARVSARDAGKSKKRHQSFGEGPENVEGLRLSRELSLVQSEVETGFELLKLFRYGTVNFLTTSSVFAMAIKRSASSGNNNRAWTNSSA